MASFTKIDESAKILGGSTDKEELAQGVLEVITVFAARLYRSRRNQSLAEVATKVC